MYYFWLQSDIVAHAILFFQNVDVTLLDPLTASVTKSAVLASVGQAGQAPNVPAVLLITMTTAILAV